MKYPFAPVLIALLTLAVFPRGGSVRAESDNAIRVGEMKEYAGSAKCGSCHQIQYKGWIRTFHGTVIQDARKNPGAVLAEMSAPDLPFSRKDIDFTIGGHWDQRYLTRLGDDYYILPRLWSVQSKKWRPYSTYGWQKRPYSRYCIGCHSVGFDPKEKAVAEHGVGCESCHGAGAAHSEVPRKRNIVNPRALPPMRSEEICASCHVRGKDLSGEFFFPIGYRPGDNLSLSLVPLEKNEKETVDQAIHRLWSKWKADREEQARSRCEVCGIHQSVRPKGESVTVDDLCMSCHEYGDKLPGHTRHKASTRITCNDCHHQKDPGVNENKDYNVHSYGFFLIHPQGCWDPDIYKACGKCHADKTEKWAYDIFTGWKKPFIVDH